MARRTSGGRVACPIEAQASRKYRVSVGFGGSSGFRLACRLKSSPSERGSGLARVARRSLGEAVRCPRPVALAVPQGTELWLRIPARA